MTALAAPPVGHRDVGTVRLGDIEAAIAVPRSAPSSGVATGTMDAAWRSGLTPNTLLRLKFPSIATAAMAS